jgi:hypothetical protein
MTLFDHRNALFHSYFWHLNVIIHMSMRIVRVSAGMVISLLNIGIPTHSNAYQFTPLAKAIQSFEPPCLENRNSLLDSRNRGATFLQTIPRLFSTGWASRPQAFILSHSMPSYPPGYRISGCIDVQ